MPLTPEDRATRILILYYTQSHWKMAIDRDDAEPRLARLASELQRRLDVDEPFDDAAMDVLWKLVKAHAEYRRIEDYDQLTPTEREHLYSRLGESDSHDQAVERAYGEMQVIALELCRLVKPNIVAAPTERPASSAMPPNIFVHPRFTFELLGSVTARL